MAGLGKRLFRYSAAPVACALAALWAAPAQAESDFHLFSADTLELTGDVRLVAVDGEKSWVDGGFGKLRSSGSDGDFQSEAAARQRQPRLAAAIHLVAVGDRRRLAPGRRADRGRPQPGLSELQADARRTSSLSRPAPA